MAIPLLKFKVESLKLKYGRLFVVITRRPKADVVISADLSPRVSVLAKEFGTNSAGEEEQPNASKASTCDSNVERQTSSRCDEFIYAIIAFLHEKSLPSLKPVATICAFKAAIFSLGERLAIDAFSSTSTSSPTPFTS